jgi:hypothetical protein
MVAYSPLAMRRWLSGSRHCRGVADRDGARLGTVGLSCLERARIEFKAVPVFGSQREVRLVDSGHLEIRALWDLLPLAAVPEVKHVTFVVTAGVPELGGRQGRGESGCDAPGQCW